MLIVGGGVIGAAILFELRRRGVDARLIEGGHIGRGSTGKSAAIVRMHYSNAPVVRMALRSREIFRDFTEITGSAPVYFKTGWSYAVPASDLATVRATAAMNRDEGVHVVELTGEHLDDAAGPVPELYPGLLTDGIGALFFEPESGFADPYATTRGYIEAARSLGASVQQGTPAVALEVVKGKVVAVQTDTGSIAAGTVVIAAGAWSATLLATAGIDIPLEISKEQELYLDVAPSHRPRACMSDLVDQIYFRPYLERDDSEGAIVLGRGYPKPYEVVDPDSYDEAFSPTFEQDVRQRLGLRLPHTTGAASLGGVTGLYAVTPDWHPFLGTIDGVENLVLATGGSGHCFKLAPAIGEMVAADIAGDAVNYADIELFNLRRVKRGTMFTAAIGGNRA